MQPNNNPNDRRVGTPLVPQRSSTITSPSRTPQEAAADVARHQLENIYGGNTSQPTPQTTPVVEQSRFEVEETPQYQHQEATHTDAEQWKQYHSAWQQYYQQYYERFYLGEVHKAKQSIEAQAPTRQKEESVTEEEALHTLQGQLRQKIARSARNIRKSRHFIPITAAICVMLLFGFLQYNRVIFANVQAYVSPGNIDPVNIIVDPTSNTSVGPESKLIIPKINVDVPIIFNVTPDYDSQMKAMEKGVAWFGIPGANSMPGQVGNTVLSGHSSNDIIDPGDYKFIFARLDSLANGDLVYVNYKSKRYTYQVKKKEVVQPTEVDKLVYDTKKPVLTLITCTPLGTSLNRLLVTAEQISPDPAKASQNTTESTESAEMPGNSPTFVQRLFGQ